MGWKDFFSNSFETTDQNQIKELQTHYYGNDYENVKSTISRIAKNLGYQVNHIDDRFKEMSIISRKAQMVITLASISYYETSVDIKIITHYVIAAKRGVRIVDEFYQELNRNLNFKQVGSAYER